MLGVEIAKNRGGRPTERGEAKRSAIAVRTTAATKESLQAAADANGRSLTQEIEQRLERSVALDEMLGGHRTIAVFIKAAEGIRRIQEATGEHWLDDVATWHGARRIIENTVNSHRAPTKNMVELAAAYTAVTSTKAKLDNALGAHLVRFPRSPLGSYGLRAIKLLEEAGTALPYKIEDRVADFDDNVQPLFDRWEEAKTALEKLFEPTDAESSRGIQLADALDALPTLMKGRE